MISRLKYGIPLIVIPQSKLFELNERIYLSGCFTPKWIDVLAQAVKSISQLINHTGMINLDFGRY